MDRGRDKQNLCCLFQKERNCGIKCVHMEICWQLFVSRSKTDNKVGVEMSNSIYHEKQVRELCALHALNNLFQQHKAFTKEEFDQICASLSPSTWINPHKSLMGFGNYDINVIMTALQRKGYEAIWFDKRKDPKCLNLPVISGFILNIPGDYKLMLVQLLMRRKHWVAIREIDGNYYNLDSKLDAPELIGKGEDLLVYLKTQLESKEKELFVIIPVEIERSQVWQLPEVDSSNVSMHVVGSQSASCDEKRDTASHCRTGAGGCSLLFKSDERTKESKASSSLQRSKFSIFGWLKIIQSYLSWR